MNSNAKTHYTCNNICIDVALSGENITEDRLIILPGYIAEYYKQCHATGEGTGLQNIISNGFIFTN
jgi:hypothetical protein